MGSLSRPSLRNLEFDSDAFEDLAWWLSGCWSRRISQEHRRVYQVLPAKIRILSCRFHY